MGKASEHLPALVVLTHEDASCIGEKSICLVGKGIEHLFIIIILVIIRDIISIVVIVIVIISAIISIIINKGEGQKEIERGYIIFL